MHLLVLFLALLCPGFLFGGHAAAGERTLTRAQLAEEIRIVHDAIRDHHPNAFFYQSRNTFAALRDQLIDELEDENTSWGAYRYLTALASSICDRQTYVSAMSSDARALEHPDRLLMPGFVALPDRLLAHIAGDRDPDLEPVGEMHGWTPEEVHTVLHNHAPTDGCEKPAEITWNSFADPAYVELFNFLAEYQESAFYLLESEMWQYDSMPEEEVEGWLCCGYEMAEFPHFFDGKPVADTQTDLQLVLSGFDLGLRTPLLYAGNPSAAGSIFTLNPGISTAYLALHTFTPEWLDLLQLQNSLEAMRDAAYDNLVVDLQGNLGRDWQTMEHVLEELGIPADYFAIEFQHLNYRIDEDGFAWDSPAAEERHYGRAGNCEDMMLRHEICLTRSEDTMPVSPMRMKVPAGKRFVLIDERTGGAALTLARILREKLGATVVGHTNETAELTTCHGAVGSYLLPHSGLVLRMPFTCIEWAFQYVREPLPDIEILPSKTIGSDFETYRGVLIKYVLRSIINDRSPASRNSEAPDWWNEKG